ncbi:kinase-regulated stress-responsive transcription factor skn7 [Exophiala xenobiotica]|uniref:Transcription factor n=1 Tax=Vermiconidia calcicola TaxID=1690605 RepID=A0AAV9Q175_9PEZI|nr:kinase-regulated stress-responsive transcription factor skn7 [Exophiala xenobiotica]KAK5533312.1 kinase-regulated stress-responsive transcription factor skn7 [Vermiconidia calcicola]KAK5534266.1 kinase-regulated stress-responsive transcription factor skn7 [Chaetothyriales sp. CCFEE 6169]KAK5205768.1 kinase-regulated stress-responsive transcription factor skn7 [Exophiala xenobiotica]KAK5216975.1 kinase-regulated stress-responsive transcription factor skn7 [Exophiala xenobiotica]
MDNQGGAGGGSNNSSDFVRKLYKMLEDPTYSSVVRWGDDGDSFVVLENEKFTKSILPKHFKHSNFASFVRQLNKYDFHKVRQNNEEGGTSIYGANAWEFRHPEFKANSKATLDNIRRKAPAPRKPSNLSDEQIPIQQIDLMNQQIVAQAQQIESLVQTTTQLQMNHQMVVQELLRLQKTVLNHDHVMQDVMTFLHTVDAKQRRDSKALFAPQSDPAQTSTTLTPTSQTMPQQEDDVPASPLQHASKLLSDLNADGQFNIVSLEQMNTNVATPPIHQDPRSMQFRGPNSATSSGSMGFVKMDPAQLETAVYPMGTSNGIDPMSSEYIHSIPYPMPSKDTQHDPRAQFADSRKKSGTADPGWARSPRILLVEDDPTCRQIGGKFLYSFNCSVDSAFDGLEAVSKMQEGNKYDMILMDIIMPNLDGVSACHIIRQFDRTPIVAMTSNIRSDDIQMYFHHGMDDVLPKPFTRKSLLDMLEKHLMHLKKVPQMEAPPMSVIAPAGGLPSTSHSVRDDLSAGASPAGSSGTWNSPSQYSGASPVNPNMHLGAVPQQQHYIDANGNITSFQNGPQTPMGMRQNAMQNQAHRRGQSEMSGGGDMGSANKRQRIYAPQQSMAAPVRQ